MQHRLRGVSRLAYERCAIASTRLSGGINSLLAECSEALRQKAGEARESTHRIAEVDLLASKSIEVGGLSGFSAALPDRQISKRDKALEMSVRDSSVHPSRFGSIVDRPFGLAHIKLEQDPASGSVLDRADRAVELA